MCILCNIYTLKCIFPLRLSFLKLRIKLTQVEAVMMKGLVTKDLPPFKLMRTSIFLRKCKTSILKMSYFT